ncbi:MAG: mannitol-1-phosphate 5-dehydrogenase [Thermoleophilia bacterium]
MEITYCQIGAGKLGLGLVYPLFAPQAHRSILLQRPGEKESSTRNIILKEAGQYSVAIGPTITNYLVDEFVELNDQGRELALEALVAADVIAIATGARTENCWELLVEADRRKTKLCAVLVFENGVRCSTSLLDLMSSEMKYRFENLIACDVVCDRICTEIELKDSQVIVHTEEFCDVTIGAKAPLKDNLANLLPGATGVRIVSDDQLFDAYERRKAWLVNSAHYTFAALGRKKGARFTVDMAARDENIRQHVRRMHKELALALLLWMNENGVEPVNELELSELLEYAQVVRQRVAAGPKDEIGRIFKPLLEYSERGSMHSDLVGHLKEKNDLLLVKYLKVMVERKQKDGVSMTVVELIDEWKNRPEVRRYKQNLASEMASFVANLIRRIGLSSFFEKARARLHEPLEIILNALHVTDSAVGYPVYTTEALLAVQDTVQFFVNRAEQDAAGGG